MTSNNIPGTNTLPKLKVIITARTQAICGAVCCGYVIPCGCWWLSAGVDLLVILRVDVEFTNVLADNWIQPESEKSVNKMGIKGLIAACVHAFHPAVCPRLLSQSTKKAEHLDATLL
jgi:hypothetical protein